MATLQIRELPQNLYAALNYQAQQQHRSLSQQAIAELERALQPQMPGLKRLQTLQMLRNREKSPVQLEDQLERWQREDRER